MLWKNNEQLFLFNLSDLTSEEVMISFSSIYWMSGFATLIMSTLFGSTRVITTEGFHPGLMLKIVEKYKVRQSILKTHLFQKIFKIYFHRLL